MNASLTILLCFSITFGFAFGMAWSIPLVTAGSEERGSEDNPNPKPTLGDLIDIVLLLMNMLPFVQLFKGLRETPQTISAAKRKWQSDKSVRESFYIFMLCVVTGFISLILLGK